MTDQYQGWRDRLKAYDEGRPVPSVIEDQPESGYYRVRDGKDRKWVPVVIWAKDGKIQCVVGKFTRDPIKVWLLAAKNPISKELFGHAFKTGEWLDDKKPNTDDKDDPYEALISELDHLVELTEQWEKDNPDGVADKLAADVLRNRENRVGEILNAADAMFEAKKKPVLALARDIDAQFHFRKNIAQPLRKKLKALWGAFATSEERRLKAEAAKAHAEELAKAQAERDRLTAERAKQMEEDPIAALTSDPEELPPLPDPPSVKVAIGGAVGSKGGLKTVWLAEVTDYKAAAEFFHDHGEMKALIDKLAKRVATNSKTAGEHKGFIVKSMRVAS